MRWRPWPDYHHCMRREPLDARQVASYRGFGWLNPGPLLDSPAVAEVLEQEERFRLEVGYVALLIFF